MQITDSRTVGLLTWKGWTALLVGLYLVGLAVDQIPF